MKKPSDICLLLEGTYPFVSGGVSSWVHHLVTHLPHLTFSVLHISPTHNFYKKGALYDMPENVVSLDEVHLHEYAIEGKADPEVLRAKVQKFRGMVVDMQEGGSSAFESFVHAVEEGASGALSGFHFLQTLEGWKVLVDTYRREAEEESFLNFFWTWRFAFLPLFNVISAKIPRAHAYHTISTGYAGLLAAAAKVRTGNPMLLTEHGIYTKERRIEVNRADWIEDWDSGEIVAQRTVPYFKRYWIRQFQMMSTVTYNFANSIYTLYEGNRTEEIKDGADPNKVEVVPNGIDIDRFDEAAERFAARPPNKRFTIGFVGRVCPIKDVRTLLAATCIVAEEVPDVRLRILGPMEEDPEYAGECQRYAVGMGIGDNVAFEGRVNVLEELPTLDVLVLSSISEAQPLVVLEGNAVGLPLVATDVGSCSELLFGRTAEDRALGPGGLLTSMASPGETAQAILRLYRDPALRKRLGESGRQRVRKHYDQRDMTAAYDAIYQKHIALSKEEVRA